MDRFLLNYNGNKYREVKKFLSDEIKEMNYDIIAEPFCGIFGFSRVFYLLNENKNTKFYLNDINSDIINLYKDFQKDFDRTIEKIEEVFEDEEYKKADDNITKVEIIKNSYILQCIFKMGIGSIMCKHKGIIKIKNFKLKKLEYIEMLKRCEFFNLDQNDFIKHLQEVKENDDKKKILIYYDPPYFNSNNNDYAKYIDNIKKAEEYNDGTTMYINIFENMKNIKNIDQIITMNKIDIINYIFKEFKQYEETGTYGCINIIKNGTNYKSKKHHITYSTFKINCLKK